MAEQRRAVPPIVVEISAGELVDKLTILEIKSARIRDTRKLAHVHDELLHLQSVRSRALAPSTALDELTAELRDVNELLWDIEDDLRRCEAEQDFGVRFVELARAVYFENDRRAGIKRRINSLLGSRLVEEKSYAPSSPAARPPSR